MNVFYHLPLATQHRWFKKKMPTKAHTNPLEDAFGRFRRDITLCCLKTRAFVLWFMEQSAWFLTFWDIFTDFGGRKYQGEIGKNESLTLAGDCKADRLIRCRNSYVQLIGRETCNEILTHARLLWAEQK